MNLALPESEALPTALPLSTVLSTALTASVALSNVLIPLVAAPTPPGIPGNTTAAASTTTPKPSTIAAPALPALTLLTKLSTPVTRLNTHADSI